MKILRGLLLLAPTAFGCKVYDETLLQRRDASADLGDVADVAPDAPADASDAPALDAPDVADATTMDAFDAGPPTDVVDVASDLAEVAATDAGEEAGADVRDAPDVPPSCDPVVAAGQACIEPVTGHGWRADDPRMVAPHAVATLGGRALVSDRGTGRVLSFDLAAPTAAPTVFAGNGLVGPVPAIGSARAAVLGEIVAMTAVGDDDVVLADATSQQVLRSSAGRVDPVPMLAFQSAPGGVAWAADAGELYLSGDNRIFSVSLSGGGASGVPEALVGLPCGANCATTFNGDGLVGASTALASPQGLDLDADYVYFADRDNCRVRRFRRRDADRVVTTVAGTVCDATSDPFAGLGTFALPTQLRLGRVTDVKVGSDGSIYFIDDSRCAVFGVTPARGAGSDPIPRIVAGAAAGCGVAPAGGGPAIGRLGRLAMTADRNAVLFVERAAQRVGRITGTANGGTAVVDFPFAPGPIPSSGELGTTARIGVPRGLAVGGNGSAFYVTGAPEGRAYRLNAGELRTIIGEGLEVPAEGAVEVPTALFPPSPVEGASISAGRTLFAFPDLGVITEMVSGNLRRIAGRYPAALVAPSPSDGGVSDAGPRDAATDVTPVDAGPALATATRFERPVNPFGTPSATLFGDARGRLWRVANDGSVEHLAGSGSVTLGSVPTTGTGVTATTAALGSVAAVAADGTGRLFVADRARHVVWSVGLETPPRARIVAGVIDRRAPLADAAAFGPEFILDGPAALAFDGRTTIYIADAEANRIRALDVLTGQVTNVAGSGAEATPAPAGDYGPARAATLSRPSALAYDNGRLYVAEAASGRVRVVVLPR